MLDEYSDEVCRCEMLAGSLSKFAPDEHDRKAVAALLAERKELLAEIARLKVANVKVIQLPAQRQTQSGDDVTAAVEMVAEIEELVEQLPARGEVFGQSVLEKATAIRDRVEQSGTISEAQAAALENMLAGVRRWIRD